MEDYTQTYPCSRIQKEVYAGIKEDSNNSERIFVLCKHNEGSKRQCNIGRRCLARLAVQREEKKKLDF